MTTREQTATHEAGHAVCALLLGKSYGCHLHANGGGMAGPDSADLATPAKAEDYGTDRLTSAAAYGTGGDVRELLDDSTLTAAGCVAVSMARCEPFMQVVSFDRNMIAANCRAALPETEHNIELVWTALAVARATALLRFNMPRVERVAAALAQCGRLSADEVCRLAFPESVAKAGA
jgi:hypothetical protein